MGNSRDRRNFRRAVRRVTENQAQVLTSPPTAHQPMPKNAWERLFDFAEQPLVLGAFGVLGGIVGALVYWPVFIVCGICVLLGFHRARVVDGRSWAVQIPSYALIFTIVVVAGWYINLAVLKAKAPPAAAPPNVEARFVYDGDPNLVIMNVSDAIARNIKWAVGVWDLDLPERNDPLPIPIATFDWIRPHVKRVAR